MIQYFIGAISVGDLIKSTLGPKGMDKILQPMNMEGSRPDKPVITNDGATILKSIWLDNPAAKILVDTSMQQDAQCGDGTTGVVVLAAELLRNAEIIVEKQIHPQIVCRGFRLALAAARDALDAVALDNGDDPILFKENLKNIALTTLSSKMLTHEK
ncbi:t-complex protein beta subunit, partial [Cardiosporidium cionae]